MSPDELLPLALSRPAEAYAEATKVLAGQPDAGTASIARQARAIVLRDRGQTSVAIAELRGALRLADRSGDAERLADVRATLGLTLGLAGRTVEGLSLLNLAIDGSAPAATGRMLMRRATVLRVLTRYDDALADLRRAITLLHQADDAVWEARSRMNRFVVYAALGRMAPADRDLGVAERLFAATGQELESAHAIHNRAFLAHQAGDLPAALGYLDETARRYTALDAYNPDLPIDRCHTLLAAGLAAEAVTVAEAALETHHARGGDRTKGGELLFTAAQAALAADRPALAAQRAAQARTLFRRQGRHVWQARVEFLALQSRYALGQRDSRLRARADRLADRLGALNTWEAPAAHLLAGQLAAGQGRTAEADRHLAEAARSRRRGPTFGQPAGWLAHALRAQHRGAVPAMLLACHRGLDAAGEHLRGLAAPELRAHAAIHGAELATLAQRLAVHRGDARMLLLWSERWRAGALAVPPVRPPDDQELATELATLRDINRRLDAAIDGDAPTARLLAQRRAVEAEIRARTRRARGGHAPLAAPDPVNLPTLVDGFAGRTLVELSTVDGELYAVTVVANRVRMHHVGSVAAAVREVELARFLLRRLAHGRPPRDVLATLAATGELLQATVLGPAAAQLAAGQPVVVAPTAALHAVPWGLLPALRDTPFTVTPSAATWLRAARLPVPRQRRVVLVVGPGLTGTDAEVAELTRGYPDATVLRDGRATAEATLRALDGAWTAHVAAHGVFRGDNPLFSAVSLDDGPLTVYDLGRLRRAPRRLVLSSCESAVAAPVGGDELLGMISALVPLGTASLLASVVQVNDAATAGLMVSFHARQRAGRDFGEALRDLRRDIDAGADPVTVAAALAFVALGH
jgi:tetratricopeptide (TPR) repeat protein